MTRARARCQPPASFQDTTPNDRRRQHFPKLTHYPPAGLARAVEIERGGQRLDDRPAEDERGGGGRRRGIYDVGHPAGGDRPEVGHQAPPPDRPPGAPAPPLPAPGPPAHAP